MITMRLAKAIFVLGVLTAQAQPAHAQDAADDPVRIQEARDALAMKRFLSLLEKNPRKGTALDRVYGYHVERGSLDDFVKSLRDRLAKKPADGATWMILGLIEHQRGRDAPAVQALKKAQETRPDDALPPYYLGQALLLVGQPEQATAAFEQALAKKPSRSDLLEIFQALGRVYERTQKFDEALKVWNRLEGLFPSDLTVQEQIARTLADEGRLDAALPRYEALARKVADPFRQIELAMQAADLKVRLGRKDAALRDFETLLGKLRPDSWLYRELRAKIEEVFLRNDDQPGLVAYYEAWIKKEPDDVDAVARIGRTLASMGRAPEAEAWYQKAVKLAPSRREIRLALISQLASDARFDQAAAQYEALDRAEPNNPDTLRDWGSLVLRDTTKNPAERKSAAAAVWKRMLESKPNDPTAAAQVADLLRQAEMVDEALALYKKAIDLAGDNPQYHEYLGEYLHQLKRPQEALEAWAKIAAPPHATAKNLARLAEVEAGFGYLKEAAVPMAQAVALEGDSFDYRLKYAEILHRLERYDDAQSQLSAARKLAQKDEEKSAVLEARVTNDLSANRVAERIEELRKALAQAARPAVDDYVELARYEESDGKLPESVRTMQRAVALDPRSIPAWALLARVQESAGSLGDSAQSLRRLGEIDRKNRAEYLTGVARLEARLGRIEPALKAGRDLLEAAPGNPEHYDFFAQLCFQLGKSDEGLDALRRAVRVNPGDTKIITTLAQNLASAFRNEEALEMYWRAYEKAPTLDEKVGMVAKLAEISIQLNQLDRMMTRLKNQSQPGASGAEAHPRDLAICTAQAYASAGDLGSARAELERLLASNARDPQILQQLSKLAEEESDFESSARYQKQLSELVSSDENSVRLGELMLKAGEFDQAQLVWSKMASGKGEPRRIYAALDHLIAAGKLDAALRATEDLIRKNPADWEALYRHGLALAESKKPELAAETFQRLLQLTVADDDKSAQAQSRKRDPSALAASARPSSSAKLATPSLQDRLGNIYQIRSACKLETQMYYNAGGMNAVWGPADFGEARMAAMGWRLTLADRIVKKGSDKIVEQYRETSQKAPVRLRDAWDWFYLCSVRNDHAAAYSAALALSRAAPADPLALWTLLHAIGERTTTQGQRYYRNNGGEAQDREPPLPKPELDHVLACFQAMRARRPELAQAEVLVNIAKELKRAKRKDEETQIYNETIASALQLPQIAGVFDLAAERGDVDGLMLLLERYERLSVNRPNPMFYTGTFYFQGPGLALSHGMAVRADRKDFAGTMRLLDGVLAQLERKIERQTPSAARSARRRGSANMGYAPQYQIWIGKQSQYIQIGFPRQNEYLDSTAIQVIRTAYGLYKRADLVSDLLAHLEKKAQAAKTPQAAVAPRLARSAIFWWGDDKDQAIEEFAKVALESPIDSEMRLDLAELLEQKGERADALATADGVQPYDTQTLQRREEIALRLAVSSGGIDRARTAAERLFGLRLETEAQVKLAGQMSQLGLGELAESVLARARRRAGNKASALVSLMMQYQAQAKLDSALQIAAQILRSTTAVRQNNFNYYNPGSPDQAREAAIGVLNRSGKLPELIARATEQVKKTPSAIQPHQALADYYKAAGDRKKAAAELAAIVALKPDDANLRLQVAGQLSQDNQHDLAIEHYKILVEKNPASLGNAWNQVLNTFQAANKSEELLDLLEKIDLRQFGQPWMITNMISWFQDPKLARRVIGLFKRAWEAFPDQRQNLLAYMSGDAFWQSPEVYGFLHEAVIPRKATFATGQQWDMLVQMLYNAGYSNGMPRTAVSRLIDAAEARGRLDELAAEVDQARPALPGWAAGDVFKAMIDLRQERYPKALPALERYLAESRDDPYFKSVGELVGDELERHGETHSIAIRFYEQAMMGESRENVYYYWGQPNGAANRLVNLYKSDNRPEDARRVLLRSADNELPANYDQEYALQMRMNELATTANQLRDLGYAADAAAFYSRALEIARGLTPDSPYFFGDPASMKTQYEQGLDAALEELNPADLVDQLTRALAGEPKSKDAKAGDQSVERARNKGSLVDVSLIVNPRDVDRAGLRGLTAEALAAGAKGDAQEWAKLVALLDSAQNKHPDDLSLAVAIGLAALDSADSARVEPALKRLLEVADKSGLEPLSEGARANARQRAEAAKLLPLWLVARAAGKHKDAPRFARLTARLGEIAIEAARRQSDNLVLLAMHREQGELALKQADRALALAAWSRMLESVMPAPTRSSAKAAGDPAKPIAATPPQTPAAPKAATPTPKAATPKTKAATPPQTPTAPAPKAATPKTSTAPRINPRILTIDRFEQAMAIAKLAADNDLLDLSFKAVHESLSGGPPVIPPPTTVSRYLSRSTNDDGTMDAVPGRVESALAKVEDVWRKKHAAADRVYDALREIVLPTDRPTEIFLYAAAIDMRSIERPRSVSRRLAESAAQANRLGDLEKLASARQGPAAVLPRDVLLAQCALASGDPAKIARALGELHDRHKNEAARTTAELLCHVALPAYFQGTGDVRAKALAVIASSEKSLEGANQAEPLGTIMLRIARAQLDAGEIDLGRKRLEAFLEVKDRTRPNYGGDYGLYVRRQELDQVASLYARAGLWKEALDALGRMADVPGTTNYGGVAIGLATSRTLELLSALAAPERYQALLEWTMPKEGRKAIRLLTAVPLPQPPPAFFLPAAVRSVANSADPESADRMSTASALIAAARDCGKLDQLAEQAKALAALKDAAKVENALDLSILIEATRGQPAAIAKPLEERIAKLSQENAEAVAKLPLVDWTGRNPWRVTPNRSMSTSLTFSDIDWLIARTLLKNADPAGKALGTRLGEALADRAELGQNGVVNRSVRTELLRATAQTTAASTAKAAGALASWRPAPRPMGLFGTSEPQSGWISHEGRLARPYGPAGDILYLDVPITGEYEFSVDVMNTSGSSGLVALNGLSIAAPTEMGPAAVSSLGWGWFGGQQEGGVRAAPWRRFTIKATPNQTRYFVDGRLIYTDLDPAKTSPWLGLEAGNQACAVFRRPTLTGRPIIPREVPLVDGDRLDGWVALYNERASVRPSFDANGSAYPPRPKRSARGVARSAPKKPRKLEDYAWAAQNGEILGRRKPTYVELNRYEYVDPSTSDPEGQSVLCYARPLEDGDAVSYEFYHEAGETGSSPALGRVVFLLEQGGVKLHWLTSDDATIRGLAAMNQAVDPAALAGARRPLLKAGAWNTARVAVDGGRVKVEINGQTLVDRPVEAGQGRCFGLYHDKTATAVRVRNVVLKGRWPLTFPAEAQADLTALAPNAPRADADRTSRFKLIGEDALGLSAEFVLDQSRSLPPADRYQKLAQWVLPSPDHPLFRLEGAFTPSFPAAAEPESPGAARLARGGELVAAALAMVDLAKEIGELDALEKQIAAARTGADDAGAIALLALIDLAKGDDAAASVKLKTLSSYVGKLSPRGPRYERWPGVVPAARALDRPGARAAAIDLLKVAAEKAKERSHTLEETRSPDWLWERQIAHLIGLGEYATALERHAVAGAFGSDPPGSPWSSAAHTAVFTRGGGFPIPGWTHTGGAFTHLPGHDRDFLYLNTPLRGDFELACEFNTGPGRQISVMYAGVCHGLSADSSALERSRYGDFMPPQAITPPLETKNEWHSLRLKIKERRMTVAIDGRDLLDASAPDDRDPWLALFSEALGSGSVRKLSITGKPQVPDKLALSKRPDLDGWDCDEYGEFTLGDAAGWRKVGAEIAGKLQDNLPLDFKRESTLRYHRPLLEDDAVSYEFFHEPGVTMVHPALGRRVFLIEPDGVKIHLLTDASYERSGLTPDNVHDEPGHRRGPASPPLKPKAWNKLVLAVKGNSVSITLNDQLIHESPIPPTNSRVFGFFHYKDATDARIRSVTLEGNWPRQPPESLAGVKP